MIDAGAAYAVGYLANTIGIHFNGAEILIQAKRGATEALAARVTPILEGWPAKGPAIVANVQRIEGLLRAAGLAPPVQPPRTLDEHVAWVDAIRATVNTCLTDRPDLAADVRLALFGPKWSFTLGTTIGDILHTLNLGAIVHWLLDAAPSHAWLRAQAGALGEGQAAARDKLRKIVERTAFLHTFGAATQQRAEQIARLVDGAPVIGAAAPDLGRLIQETMRAIEAIDLEPTFS
jgi:hypothetical protein